MRYTFYGHSERRGPTHAELLAHATEHQDLLARAEDSGCEGCYVEVARYCEKHHRFERYCFEKVFGGEHPSDPSRPENGDHPAPLTCYQTAELFAAEINEAGDAMRHPLIHGLPSCEG